MSKKWEITFDDGDHAEIEAINFRDAVDYIKRVWKDACTSIVKLEQKP